VTGIALPPPTTVTIPVTRIPAATFAPACALGAGIDGAEKGTADSTFRPKILAAMRSLKLRPLTYRLRTELGIEAWHWNGRGRWSDHAHARGYWTGSADPKTGPVGIGWGYRLPHRGSTVDQANDDGYSRIDDGDLRTYWKSNPYLDRRFTGESNRLHPQWVLVDLGQVEPVNAIRLAWGRPFATQYRMEYGITTAGKPGDDLADTVEPEFRWLPFPGGAVTAGHGAEGLLRLCRVPIRARFVRLVMTASSGESAGAAGGGDIRDRVGYALREMSVGQIGSDGRFHDAVHHGAHHDTQSAIIASSCDPWHTAADRDERTEQPGFDRVWNSGLANGQPVLVPVGVLYDTPENAVAELRYLKARGLAFTRVELGEEPDGQYVLPEDYAALYCRFAQAIRTAFPKVALGGPSLQTDVNGWHTWPDAAGERRWMTRFLRYLQSHDHAQDFQFFSFEWYPFDDLRAPAAKDLAQHAALLDGIRADLLDAGVSPKIPWLISEYGWSPFASESEVDIPGALLNAEIPVRFLQQSGSGSIAYFYGYEPNTPILELPEEGGTWGNMTPFLAGNDGNILCRLPLFWSAALLTTAWAEDGPGAYRPHQLYRASVSGDDPLLAAYPVRRPDGRWSVLLLNKDTQRARTVQLRLAPEGGAATAIPGPLEIWQYGPAQYAWKSDGVKGHPIRNLPPEHRRLAATMGRNGAPTAITVPPFTLCVVRFAAPGT